MVNLCSRLTWKRPAATSTPTSPSRWSPLWSTSGQGRSYFGRRQHESTVWSSSTVLSTFCQVFTPSFTSRLGSFSGNAIVNGYNWNHILIFTTTTMTRFILHDITIIFAIIMVMVVPRSPNLCLLNAVLLHLLIVWNRLVPVAISFFDCGFIMDIGQANVIYNYVWPI